MGVVRDEGHTVEGHARAFVDLELIAETKDLVVCGSTSVSGVRGRYSSQESGLTLLAPESSGYGEHAGDGQQE